GVAASAAREPAISHAFRPPTGHSIERARVKRESATSGSLEFLGQLPGQRQAEAVLPGLVIGSGEEGMDERFPEPALEGADLQGRARLTASSTEGKVWRNLSRFVSLSIRRTWSPGWTNTSVPSLLLASRSPLIITATPAESRKSTCSRSTMILLSPRSIRSRIWWRSVGEL